MNKRDFNNTIRTINLFLFLILLILFVVKDLRIIGAYFFAYFYLWFMIMFLFQEIRHMILRKINFVKHIKSDWKIFLGFLIALFFIINQFSFF